MFFKIMDKSPKVFDCIVEYLNATNIIFAGLFMSILLLHCKLKIYVTKKFNYYIKVYL